MRKFRNKQKTNVLSLTMLLLLSILLISQPLTVQAGEEDADVTDLVHYVNSTGGGGGGGTGTVPNGMKYTRTGYLCYLVNNDTSGGDSFNEINPYTGQPWKEGDVMNEAGFIYNGDNSEVSKLFHNK